MGRFGNVKGCAGSKWGPKLKPGIPFGSLGCKFVTGSYQLFRYVDFDSDIPTSMDIQWTSMDIHWTSNGRPRFLYEIQYIENFLGIPYGERSFQVFSLTGTTGSLHYEYIILRGLCVSTHLYFIGLLLREGTLHTLASWPNSSFATQASLLA